jgi:hypothetical protein
MKRLLLLLLTCSTPACFGQLLNADFESPDIPTGTSQVGLPTSWIVLSTVTIADLPAYSPTQIVGLYGVHPGEIYQRVQTVPGQFYTIRFDWLVPVPPTTPSLPKAEVTWNGVDLLDLYAQDDIQWRTASLTVEGTGNTTPKDRLSFLSTGGQVYIDNVTMTVVPEPESMLATSAGIVAFIGMRLLRKRPRPQSGEEEHRA